jgi:hypothetical protein
LEDTGEDEYQLADEPALWRDDGLTKSNHRDQEELEEEDEYRLSDVADQPPPPRPRPTLEDDDLDLDLAPLAERDDAKSPRRERGVVLQDHNPLDDASMIQERRDRLRLEDRLAAEARSRRNSNPPDYPFLSGVFNFPFYGSSWPRWLGLTAGTALVYYLVANAVASARFGGAELFFSLIFATMAGSAALLLIVFEAVAVLAVVQDTAAGADEVEGWPDFNFVEWAGQAFYFINALAFSAAPGFLLASVTDSLGPWRWAAPAITAALLYPIVLLSQLDGMSPFSILTPGVIKGALKSPSAWMAFYGVSLGTIAAAAAICWVTVKAAAWDGPVAAIVLATVTTTALLVESRLIGRLAWFCEETEPVVEPEESEEAPAEEREGTSE